MPYDLEQEDAHLNADGSRRKKPKLSKSQERRIAIQQEAEKFPTKA